MTSELGLSSGTCELGQTYSDTPGQQHAHVHAVVSLCA